MKPVRSSGGDTLAIRSQCDAVPLRCFTRRPVNVELPKVNSPAIVTRGIFATWLANRRRDRRIDDWGCGEPCVGVGHAVCGSDDLPRTSRSAGRHDTPRSCRAASRYGSRWREAGAAYDAVEAMGQRDWHGNIEEPKNNFAVFLALAPSSPARDEGLDDEVIFRPVLSVTQGNGVRAERAGRGPRSFDLKADTCQQTMIWRFRTDSSSTAQSLLASRIRVGALLPTSFPNRAKTQDVVIPIRHSGFMVAFLAYPRQNSSGRLISCFAGAIRFRPDDDVDSGADCNDRRRAASPTPR
jgi:hypothetical protein